MSKLRTALRDPAARRFLVAHAQSCLGSGLAQLALPLLAYDLTGSAWAVTAVLLPDLLPAVVLGPVIGVAVDRFGWRRCMIVADIARAAAFLVLWRAASLPAAIAGAAIAGVGSALFNPAALTAVGVLAPGAERRAATMAVFGALDDVGLTLGPALAGIALAVTDPSALMALNAGTFALSAVILVTLRDRCAAPDAQVREPSIVSAWLAGWRAIAARPRVRVLIGTSSAAVACMGITNVGEVVLARQVLDVGGSGLAALMACNGVGLVAGSLAARHESGWRWRRAYQAGLSCLVVELGLCALAPGFWALLPVFALGGFGNAYALVHDRLLLSSAAPADVHGRLFAFEKACTSLAFGTAFVVAGVLIAGVGVQAAFLTAAVALAAVLLAAAPRLTRAWPAPKQRAGAPTVPQTVQEGVR